MTDPTPILIARRYAELVDGVAMRIAQLKVPHLDVDAAAQLAEGHTSKLMCGTKCYGEESLNKHLKALGLCLVVAVDPQRAPQISDSRELAGIDAKARLALRRSIREARKLLANTLLLHSRKAGRKGGKAAAKRMNPNQLKGRARKAANARWRKERAKRTSRPQSCQAPK